jgi:hypothetical protein
MEVSGQLHAQAALPTGKEPVSHWIGGWVGCRAVLDVVMKSSKPLLGLESPIIQPVAQRCTTELSLLIIIKLSYL